MMSVAHLAGAFSQIVVMRASGRADELRLSTPPPRILNGGRVLLDRSPSGRQQPSTGRQPLSNSPAASFRNSCRWSTAIGELEPRLEFRQQPTRLVAADSTY